MEVNGATRLGGWSPGERGTGAQWLEGEVRPGTDLDALEKKKTPVFGETR